MNHPPGGEAVRHDPQCLPLYLPPAVRRKHVPGGKAEQILPPDDNGVDENHPFPEWKQYHPEAETTIVKVYAKDEDGYEFHRTKEEVYPFENWDYGDYVEDQKFAAADAWWEDHKEE